MVLFQELSLLPSYLAFPTKVSLFSFNIRNGSFWKDREISNLCKDYLMLVLASFCWLLNRFWKPIHDQRLHCNTREDFQFSLNFWDIYQNGGDNEGLVMETLNHFSGYFCVVTGEIGSITWSPGPNLNHSLELTILTGKYWRRWLTWTNPSLLSSTISREKSLRKPAPSNLILPLRPSIST